MLVPNLASRPFLNTRPVWLVTTAATLITLVLLAINIKLYGASNRDLAEQLSRHEQLKQELLALREEIEDDVAALERVPWRSLENRVTGLNVILSEHSFSWTELLGDVGSTMPYEVRLHIIEPKVTVDGVQLRLEGVARTRDAMLDFLDNLIVDPAFEDPMPDEEVDPEQSDVDGFVFSVDVKYTPIASEEPTEEPTEEPSIADGSAPAEDSSEAEVTP